MAHRHGAQFEYRYVHMYVYIYIYTCIHTNMVAASAEKHGPYQVSFCYGLRCVSPHSSFGSLGL